MSNEFIRATDRTFQPAARAIAERIAAGFTSNLPHGKIVTVSGLGGENCGSEFDDLFTVVDRPSLGGFLRHPIRDAAKTLVGVYDFQKEPDRNILVVAEPDVFLHVRELVRSAARELHLQVDCFEGTPKPARAYRNEP